MKRVVIVRFMWKESEGYIHPYEEVNTFTVEDSECSDIFRG